MDDSLIRSGRFDVKISVPKPDEASRAEIFRKMIRGLIAAHEAPGFRMFADDLDLGELGRASHGMTGADIKEVLRRVQLTKAMQGRPHWGCGRPDLPGRAAGQRQGPARAEMRAGVRAGVRAGGEGRGEGRSEGRSQGRIEGRAGAHAAGLSTTAAPKSGSGTGRPK